MVLAISIKRSDIINHLNYTVFFVIISIHLFLMSIFSGFELPFDKKRKFTHKAALFFFFFIEQ